MTALAVRVPHVPQLNWPRVGAWSGSISLHLLVVALLLVPGAAIQIVRHADIAPVVDIIVPTPAKPVPVEPMPAPLTAQPRVVRVAPAVEPVVTTPAIMPVTVDLAPPAITAAPANTATETAPSAIAYGSRTQVAYPLDALRNHEQGTVILRVLVGADGSVLGVRIERSSGSRSLDRAAREAVGKWRFHPATRNGVAHSAWASVPVTFNLKSL
ncbi:MAG: TonB family protein [Xanthomonadaceae bacterium]|nr:TonB family protein [Xanthomonadaceae bacterium]